MDTYEYKYKEALKRTMNLALTNNISATAAGEIFPELLESEDEKIRKWLINMLSQDYELHKKSIAWLEKQGEQKPTWSEEDEKKIMWLVRLISTAGYRELDNDKMPCSRSELLDWLKSLKDRVQPRPKQEWSEKDERIYQSILDDTVQENQLDGKQFVWLKSIKDRIQPNQEWSEEDNKMYDRIIKIFEVANEGAKKNNSINVEKELNWLKLLKPQKRWKPSKDQMFALSMHIQDNPNLESLYNNLKTFES